MLLWEIREIFYITQSHFILQSWTTMDIEFVAQKSGRSKHKVIPIGVFKEHSENVKNVRLCV